MRERILKKSAHQVIRRKIPIRIKNVENPRGGGTVIDPEADLESEASLSDFGSTFFNDILSRGVINGGGGGVSRERLPTAVTIKERIVVLNVQSNRKSVSHGFLAGIFGTLDRFGVVVDLISTSEVFVSMAIEDVLDRNLQARLVRDLEKIGTVCFLNPPFSSPVFCLRSQLAALRPGGLFYLGVRTSRYGDPLDGRKTDAQHGRHRGAHVRDARAGERQH
jgi:hypothetical protein